MCNSEAKENVNSSLFSSTAFIDILVVETIEPKFKAEKVHHIDINKCAVKNLLFFSEFE